MSFSTKAWNARQKDLGALLEKGQGLDLFLVQHALLHSGYENSYADEIWTDTPETTLRRIPKNMEHSMVWCLWHIARVEDMTMNMLVAHTPQLAEQDNWFQRLNIDVKHTGNSMTIEEIQAISTAMNLDALIEYRRAVAARTREIIDSLKPTRLKEKTDATQLQRILDEGYIHPAAVGILDYWRKRTIMGLLLMPPTRHNLVHLNEAATLKRKKD